MAKSQAIDGRQAYAWYLEPGSEELTSALAVGDIVIVTAQASTGSKFPTNWVNKPYIVVSAIATLTEGDKYVKLTPYFIGMAKDKSISKSKNTTSVTVDADAFENSISDGIVSVSGSISMSYSVDGKKYASTFIKQRFGAIDMYSAQGTVEVLEAKTQDKDLILFAWNARDCKADDIVEFDVLPVLFTSLDHGSSYGSSQNMDLNFTGNATDENGYEARTLNIPGGKTVIDKLAKNRAGMDEAAKPTQTSQSNG